jgi:hypothetical protein
MDIIKILFDGTMMMRMSFSSSTKLSIRHAENQNITNLQAIKLPGNRVFNLGTKN